MALPTGLTLNYTYDAAHRLSGWSNNRGEQGSFTLDGMGNRTAEQIKNSGGAIAWMAARSINHLNRLAAKTDGSNQINTFGYDANGELVAETNGLNQSTRYGLDGLRRVAAITDAASATATLSYNALDAVTQAKDFKGVATSYIRDAGGNATVEGSADVGSRSTRYDALGLPIVIVDAMGKATQIERDALGRPISLTFADGKVTELRYDLTGGAYNESGAPSASRGHLSEIADRSGTTRYKRDLFGRVTVKSQTLANGDIRRVRYSYTAGGQLDTLTYPNGVRLKHLYDATGRLVQMNWNDMPLVTGITWNPLGLPTGWTWAFADENEGTTLAATRSYDTAGRLTATEFGSYVYDAAGRITSLTQQLYKPANANPLGTAVASENVTWNVGYDAVGRIVSFGNGTNTATFSYDANGNRLSGEQTIGSQTTSRHYAVSGNRLTGFSQVASGTTTSVSYQHDANGDMASDGLRSYAYDAEGRLASVTTGASDASPTTRHAHNALGQRVFKTEPLYPPAQGDESDPGFFQGLVVFFSQLWSPGITTAEHLGYAFVYDEDGTLLGDYGMGGANSSGKAKYVYLPTANGPMPIAAFLGGRKYAVHSDHLNTPRRLTLANGRGAWQWAYSAFGDEKPTIAKYRFANLDINPNPGTTNISPVVFNLRYPGQYEDVESGLSQNRYRYYDSRAGRYTQNDPIGLDGGWNRVPYANLNPLMFTDPMGLMGQGSGTVGRPGGQSNRQSPTFSAFGCMGLACVSGGMHNDASQFSAELSFGGGIEICDPPPPPKPEPGICRKSDGGLYATTGQPQVQPPGIPVPKRIGGAFLGPAWKSNGQFCLRIGPHVSAPFVPSVDSGSFKN